ncbi:NAD(P)-binding protein [Dentipellis sp. KUC8613]|nr:NAD(P)-binding protein [Dentipellis sp. KUC8613]
MTPSKDHYTRASPTPCKSDPYVVAPSARRPHSLACADAAFLCVRRFTRFLVGNCSSWVPSYRSRTQSRGRKQDDLTRVARQRTSSPSSFCSALIPVWPCLHTARTRLRLRPQPMHNRSHLHSPRLCLLQVDLSSRPSLLAVAETMRSAHGHVGLLVNDAGIALSRHIQLPLSLRSASADAVDVRVLQRVLWDEASLDDFRTSFSVNVTGAYDRTIAFPNLLHAANARRASVPYALSKAATTHLGNIFVKLLKEYRIRSNVLAPDIFPSDMTAGVVPDEDVTQDVPLQRAAGADDMAGLILSLASRAGAYVNGTVHTPLCINYFGVIIEEQYSELTLRSIFDVQNEMSMVVMTVAMARRLTVPW